MAITKYTKLPAEVVTTTKIANNTIVNVDISSCAAIAQSKISSLSTSLSNVCSALTSATNLNNTNNFNVGLLGFKMAVNESLTVFNLVDGIVDEFQDESGVDNSASTSLTYNSTDDYYVNSTQPDGLTLNYSAGFTTTTITEPDTSTAGTNPAVDTGSTGTFTVPTNITSLSVAVWGSGGGAGSTPPDPSVEGGAGGYVSGTLSVTPGQTLYVTGGQGGPSGTQSAGGFLGGGSGEPGAHGTGGTGGGAAGVFSAAVTSPSSVTSPQVFIVAGAGGGSGNKMNGGPGGGLQGMQAASPYGPGGLTTNNTGAPGFGAGGGSQSAGGQGSPFNDSGSAGPTSNPGPGTSGSSGAFLEGGNAGVTPQGSGGGGSGFYGGGGGGGCTYNSVGGGAGGGSSYYGNPNISSGSTLQTIMTGPFPSPNIANVKVGAGIAQPGYVSCTNNGGEIPGSGQPGFVLMTATLPATTTSSTIISDPFTSTTVPTTTRIVVFEENVGTPTLNTDIVASVSRNGGTNFTNVTLSDSGYVTGSSGQRILTGQASISGQPSGQSMKWKLQLANNTVKIHGVSLSWA